MNAMKRISRNSIVLFSSFTGRNRASTAYTPSKELLKSGSSKQLQEPQIGKLELDEAEAKVTKERLRKECASSNPAEFAFEDSIESLQRRLDSQMRDNEDLKYSLQLNKESLQSMMMES